MGEPARGSSAGKGPISTCCPCHSLSGIAPWCGLAEGGMTFISERRAGGTGCHPTISKWGQEPASGNGVLSRMADTVFLTSTSTDAAFRLNS